jgi:ABC-type phosphate transport system substrate-binding protein
VTKWNQVNPAWPDAPVKLFGAGADSGTFEYFTEAMVGKAKSSPRRLHRLRRRQRAGAGRLA